jgi:hypothetical protein
MAKLHISTGKHKALEISKEAYRSSKVVYVALADKRVLYPAYGLRTRIVYIGETKRGAARITESAAKRAEEIFEHHGVNKLTFYPVTCTPRQNIKTWKKLEAALILRFREKYGKPPLLNAQGKKQQWKDETTYFSIDKIDKLLDFYSALPND